MVRPVQLMVGGDPEGFFSKGGKVIGSPRVLPYTLVEDAEKPGGFRIEGGLKARGPKPYVVLDGVQYELNPPARNSVALFAREVSIAFELLEKACLKHEVQLDWRGLVDVEREELDALPEACRILGCMPSKNIYGDKPLTVDPKIYTKRSAGGHLHFGFKEGSELFKHRETLVALLDFFVGTMGVLLDRDPGAAERRENYGRAGEYREPSYGLEYRVLSNFWLRSPKLLELVHGMANFAIGVLDEELQGGANLIDELAKVVDHPKVVQAIDTNNWDLAYECWHRVRGFMSDHLQNNWFPLTARNLANFDRLAVAIREEGLFNVFPDNHFDAWLGERKPGFGVFVQQF